MNQELLVISLKMVLALSLVLATFWGGVLFVRKFSGSAFLKRANPRYKPIEILSHQTLGPGRGLYLVQCCDKKILIGVTPQSVQQVAIFETEEIAEDFSSNLKEKMPSAEAPSMRQEITSRLGDISRV